MLRDTWTTCCKEKIYKYYLFPILKCVKKFFVFINYFSIIIRNTLIRKIINENNIIIIIGSVVTANFARIIYAKAVFFSNILPTR